MIGRYNEEMSHIHAPANLIHRTKSDMKQKETELQEKKSRVGKVTNSYKKQFAIGVSMAAAVLLLIAIPATMRFSQGSSQEISDSKAEEMKNYLVAKAEPKLQRITGKADNSAYENVLEITVISEIPEKFADLEKVVTDEYEYYLLKDQTTGCYQSAVQKGEVIYLVISKTQDKEVFLEKMNQQLANNK